MSRETLHSKPLTETENWTRDPRSSAEGWYGMYWGYHWEAMQIAFFRALAPTGRAKTPAMVRGAWLSVVWPELVLRSFPLTGRPPCPPGRYLSSAPRPWSQPALSTCTYMKPGISLSTVWRHTDVLVCRLVKEEAAQTETRQTAEVSFASASGLRQSLSSKPSMQ